MKVCYVWHMFQLLFVQTRRNEELNADTNSGAKCKSKMSVGTLKVIT